MRDWKHVGLSFLEAVAIIVLGLFLFHCVETHYSYDGIPYYGVLCGIGFTLVLLAGVVWFGCMMIVSEIQKSTDLWWIFKDGISSEKKADVLDEQENDEETSK